MICFGCESEKKKSKRSLCGDGVVVLASILVPASPGNEAHADRLSSPLVEHPDALRLTADKDGRVLRQIGCVVGAVRTEEGGNGRQRGNVVAVAAHVGPRAPVVGPAGQIALRLHQGGALLITTQPVAHGPSGIGAADVRLDDA